MNQSLAELDKEATKHRAGTSEYRRSLSHGDRRVYQGGIYARRGDIRVESPLYGDSRTLQNRRGLVKVAKVKASDTEQVLNLTIDKFSDELGNSGEVQTKTSAVKVTPLIGSHRAE
ncbi:hypothetical protein BCU32_024405 [Vibrio lentus]|uniref:hypothetical protein n=1 Tax=Vibrio lentus TaxID=136468 RepID=UPI0039A413FD